MGITGAGNMGVVLDSMFVPWMAKHYGWQAVFDVPLIPRVLVFVLYNRMAKDAPEPRRAGDAQQLRHGVQGCRHLNASEMIRPAPVTPEVTVAPVHGVARGRQDHAVLREQAADLIDRTVSGFHARVVQHENDHLDGILYPMRLRDIRLLGFEDALFPEL